MIPILMIPRVGNRVWTIEGLHQHGPMEGPLVDVPAQTGGAIVGQETRFGSALFRVHWDTGQQSGHYAKGLLCIGPFRTLDDFKAAVRRGGHSARAVFGPYGGLRKFTMDVRGDPAVRVELTSDQASIWRNVLESLLRESGISVEVETIKPAPRRRRAR